MGIVHSHEDEDKLAFLKKWNTRHFHISHNTPYLPPKILHNLFFFISPGYYSCPKRNWKQCLCKILGANKLHYGNFESGV